MFMYGYAYYLTANFQSKKIYLSVGNAKSYQGKVAVRANNKGPGHSDGLASVSQVAHVGDP